MPQLSEIQGRFRYSIERFDGGLNTKDAPSKINPFQSPDCLNVVFDLDGSARTRNSSNQFNTTTVGAFTIDHGLSYNQTMVIWSNGAMYKASGLSGTTFFKVTSSSGHFTQGGTIAAVVYQNVLFSSDGTNGPWKYSGSENFYKMGIDIPSAPTGSGTSAGLVAPGTYYYGVSNVNTQVVEGQIGSVSAGITIATSSIIGLTSVPIGSALVGVNSRYIYRATAASGPFQQVGTIADNTTTTFSDNTAVGGEGKFVIDDGSSPTPFTTIELHKERLFFDDSTNRSLMRYTDFTNPYISKAENFEPINNGDGENIVAIGAQDDFVTAFKSNRSQVIETVDPSDDLTWVKRDLPSNLGIVGPKALAKLENGLVFVGKQNYRISGLHFLTGLDVIPTADGKMRSLTITQRIEPSILENLNTAYWANTFLSVYKNNLYVAYTPLAQTVNKAHFWNDFNKLSVDGTPGAWAPWDGINSKCMFVHDGRFFSGDSLATGLVRELELDDNTYADSGSAINSYLWTKEVGGEDDGSLDSYIKDLREIYVWHRRLGNYNMNVRYRSDGSTSLGNFYEISLNNDTSKWGSMLWGTGVWSVDRQDVEDREPVGHITGRRFQVRFDNQRVAGQAFQVHRLELSMNLRRRR